MLLAAVGYLVDLEKRQWLRVRYMGILVDGYNLLFTIGLPRGATGPGKLEDARSSLLDFLAEHLQAGEASATTVVFDAKRSSRSENSQFQYRGISVRFAYEQDEADDLLELLISAFPHPNELLVVSSDRRVQTAARRRHAKVIDSESWLELLRDGRDTMEPLTTESLGDQRQQQPSAGEIQDWLDAFADADELAAKESSKTQHLGEARRCRNKNERQQSHPDKPELIDQSWDPFPPGYGEDLA